MTTLLAIRRAHTAVMGGDGQVTLGEAIQKHGAVKVRAIENTKVLAGFAGGAADAMALLDRFEGKLEEAGGHLVKAAVELARDWRKDRVLRRLEAVLLLADPDHLLLVSGTGDVLSSDDGVMYAGSGGTVAGAAARALLRHTDLDAEAICRAALDITAEIDLYTNDQLTILQTA